MYTHVYIYIHIHMITYVYTYTACMHVLKGWTWSLKMAPLPFSAFTWPWRQGRLATVEAPPEFQWRWRRVATWVRFAQKSPWRFPKHQIYHGFLLKFGYSMVFNGDLRWYTMGFDGGLMVFNGTKNADSMDHEWDISFGNQTWLARKFPMNGGSIRKLIHK